MHCFKIYMLSFLFLNQNFNFSSHLIKLYYQTFISVLRIAIICFAQTIKYRDIFRIPDVIRIQFHRTKYFSIWSPGFLLSSPGFSNAGPSTSPGFSRVRVFFSSPSPVRVSKYAHLKVSIKCVFEDAFFGGKCEFRGTT